MISGMGWDILNAALLAMTAKERWSAARRSNSSFMSEYWVILAGGVALLVLTVLLLWVSYTRRARHQEEAHQMFADTAAQRGLSTRQQQILLAIVAQSGVRQRQDIFTRGEAFYRGAARLLAECVQTRSADESEQLKSELGELQGKLGFQALGASSGKSKGPCSRDIPTGRIVEITRRRNREGASMQAEVIANDPEFTLRLRTPVQSMVGDFWRVRYTFGMSMWELDSTTVRCDGECLVLNQTDRVRVEKHRRFQRVTVKMPVLIAAYPFVSRVATAVAEASHDGPAGEPAEQNRTGAIRSPKFVDGTVTDLAGPGLLIETALNVQAGDRVLVVLKVAGTVMPDEGDDTEADGDGIIQGFGEIRQCRNTENGVMVGVELTGLADSEVDALVRITKAIAARASLNEEADAGAVGQAVETRSAVTQGV